MNIELYPFLHGIFTRKLREASNSYALASLVLLISGATAAVFIPISMYSVASLYLPLQFGASLIPAVIQLVLDRKARQWKTVIPVYHKEPYRPLNVFISVVIIEELALFFIMSIFGFMAPAVITIMIIWALLHMSKKEYYFDGASIVVVRNIAALGMIPSALLKAYYIIQYKWLMLPVSLATHCLWDALTLLGLSISFEQLIAKLKQVKPENTSVKLTNVLSENIVAFLRIADKKLDIFLTHGLALEDLKLYVQVLSSMAE